MTSRMNQFRGPAEAAISMALDRKDVLFVVAAALVLIIFIHLRRSSRHTPNNLFVRDNGQRLKCINEDTRFTRFTAGDELSKTGQQLAGSDPYLVRNGNKVELVIHKPQHLVEFLAGDIQQHTKAHNMHLGDYVGRLVGQCVGEQSGAKWKAMRSHFDPHYSIQAVTGATADLATEIDRWVSVDLSEKAIGSSCTGAVAKVDMMETCKSLTFRLIAQNLYGDMYTEQLFEELRSLYELHCQVMLTGVLNAHTIHAWYNLLPSEPRRQYQEYKSRWKRLNMKILHTAKSKSLRCPTVEMYRGVECEKHMTEEEYLQTLDEILFANVNVTGTVLAFIFINLANNPEIQSRILEEKKAAVVDPMFLARQDTLLHFTTLESLRITPSVRFSLPQLTAVAKKIDGYTLPPRMPVVVDICRLHRDSAAWKPDPEIFRPDRFNQMPATSYRYAILRFGVGTGRCLGRYLADRLLKLAIIRCLETFVLRPAVDSDGDGDEAGFTVGYKGRLELVRRAL